MYEKYEFLYIKSKKFHTYEVYSELIAMPLWVCCAFDRDGEFVFEESQQRLAAYLI